MKKLFLTGRSEAGKTSLTQALKGETLHYVKTQYTNTSEDTIDSPGEYAESKHFSAGLACFSFEADVVALVQAADEPFNLFGANCQSFILRPLIGIITKIDSPYANIPMVSRVAAQRRLPSDLSGQQRDPGRDPGAARISERRSSDAHLRGGRGKAADGTERMGPAAGWRISV